jgi:hypothetical protein
MACTFITIMDVVHRPVFYLKHKISKTGFCLGRQVERTQLGKGDRIEFPKRCIFK